MCEHIPTAITPTTAAANHGHAPNTVMVLTLSDNDNFSPETKGYISEQGLKRENRDLEKSCKNVMWVGPGNQRTGHPPL